MVMSYVCPFKSFETHFAGNPNVHTPTCIDRFVLRTISTAWNVFGRFMTNIAIYDFLKKVHNNVKYILVWLVLNLLKLMKLPSNYNLIYS